MKRQSLLPILLILLLHPLTGRAQGALYFDNYVQSDGIDARVYDVDCRTLLVGPDYVAQLYAGTTTDSLRPLAAPVPFLIFPPGQIDNQIVIVEGNDGTPIYVQMRAWDGRTGNTYEVAVTAGGKYGFSNVIVVTPTFPPSQSAPLLGLQSFCLVPEPGTWVLALLGAAGIAVARGGRRQRPRRDDRAAA